MLSPTPPKQDLTLLQFLSSLKMRRSISHKLPNGTSWLGNSFNLLKENNLAMKIHICD